jgi:hypothetical protein
MWYTFWGQVTGDFAHLYSSYLEAPPHFFYISFLTCIGNILSSRLTLGSEIQVQPRLYVILLGESTDDRKSTAISKTVEFFSSTMHDFKTIWGVGNAEGLQRCLKNNDRLLLVFDEFKQFISKCCIDSSVLLPCVTTLFESNRYENHTSQSHIILENVHLSLLAASTVPTYEKCWDSSFTDIGFNNRLFLLPGRGKRKFSFPEKIPETEKNPIRTGLLRVLDFTKPNREVNITQDAKALYHEWYTSIERSVHAKRLDTYAMKFMTLFAANELKDTIDVGLIRDVVDLMNWQLEVRRLLDPVNADNKIADMEQKIRRALRSSSMNDRELKRAVHYDRAGLWFFNTALGNLRKADEVVIEGHNKNKRYRLIENVTSDVTTA